MASSIFISSDNNAPLPEDQDQYHHHQPIRRSISGRKKPKGGGEEKKKKTPQRGMGVEKLERMRLQERWKKITEPTNNLQTCFNINQMGTGFGVMGLNPNQTTYLGFHGSVESDHFGIGGSNITSFHSSSIPNPLNCISEHSINSCHKKKKVNNAENLGVRPDMYMRMYSDQGGFLGLNVGENQKIINHSTKQPHLVPQLGCPNIRSTQTGVEVVAVHRKGSEGGSNDHVVMEYEFFPGGKKDCGNNNDDEDELVMKMMMGSSEGSTSTSCVGFGASSTSSIDLSLKLSY